jgi:hypothetical protein
MDVDGQTKPLPLNTHLNHTIDCKGEMIQSVLNFVNLHPRQCAVTQLALKCLSYRVASRFVKQIAIQQLNGVCHRRQETVNITRSFLRLIFHSQSD